MSTATRWWASLLGHAPLYRGAEPIKSHDPDGLVKMTSDLAQYFTPSRQQELLHCECVCVCVCVCECVHVCVCVCVCVCPGVPAEGNYCALKDRDGCFYRVRILRFSHPLEFMFHHKEKAEVITSPSNTPLFTQLTYPFLHHPLVPSPSLLPPLPPSLPPSLTLSLRFV